MRTWQRLDIIDPVIDESKIKNGINYWKGKWIIPLGEKVSFIDEAIQLLLMLWTKTSTTFEGSYFKVKDARLMKQTQHNAIPITIAAKKDRTMRIASRHGDLWECSYLTPEQFTTLNEKFESIYKRRIEMETEE